MKKLDIVVTDIKNIADADVIAARKCGAELKWTQRMMRRPTEWIDYHMPVRLWISEPHECDREQIINVIYQSHLHGYTSTVFGMPEYQKIAEAVDRRFKLFSETNTLHFGTILMGHDYKIVAVCLAGVYPDSPGNFATVNQISVLPEYRRRGIAKCMIEMAIDKAYSSSSPVIGLQVLSGNPAEHLYKKLGFVGLPSFSDMKYSPH